MCYVGAWFHGWLRDLFFTFIGIHVVDPSVLWLPTISCEVSVDSIVKAWSFGSRMLFCLGNVGFILFF